MFCFPTGAPMFIWCCWPFDHSYAIDTSDGTDAIRLREGFRSFVISNVRDLRATGNPVYYVTSGRICSGTIGTPGLSSNTREVQSGAEIFLDWPLSKHCCIVYIKVKVHLYEYSLVSITAIVSYGVYKF